MKIRQLYAAIIIAFGLVVHASCFATNQTPSSPPITNTTVKCQNYETPKSKVLSERAGKKIMQAYDYFMDESIDEQVRIQETIAQLLAISTKSPFDQASIDRFLGQILYQQEGKSLAAIDTLTRAVKEQALNDKEHADTLQLLANLSFREERYREGINWHKKWIAFTCDHTPFIYTQLASAYTQLRDFDNAIDMADKAIYYQQDINTSTLQSLSKQQISAIKKPFELKINAYHEKKAFRQAVSVAETLVTQFPDDEQWWPRLGFLYMVVEDFDKALSTFYLANKRGYLSKPHEYRALVQLYASNNVPYTSAQLHKKYIDKGIFEANAQEWAKLANTLQLAREYAKAAQYYGLAAKQSQDPEYYRKQGVLLMTATEYDSAIDALNLALDNNIDDPLKVHFSLMEAHFYAGNFEQAMVHAEIAKGAKNLFRNTEAWIPYIQQKISSQKLLRKARVNHAQNNKQVSLQNLQINPFPKDYKTDS